MDSLHTIATFCASPVALHLPRQGAHPRPREIDDYMALFRWVAHVIGTPPARFVTAASARTGLDSAWYLELEPSPAVAVVARNFIECLRDVPGLNLSPELVAAVCRRMNDQEICDELELLRPELYYQAMVYG